MVRRTRLARAFAVLLAITATLVGLACIGDPPIPPEAPVADGGCTACDGTAADTLAAPDTSVDAGLDSPADAAPFDADGGALHSFPLHTTPGYYVPDAGSLPDGVTDIDTDNRLLKIDAGAPSLPPAVSFEYDGNAAAILSIGAWHVTKDVLVHGTHPLIVVAAGAVKVDAIVHGEAIRNAPGPGGSPPTTFGASANPKGGGANGIAGGGGNGGSGGGGGGFGSVGGGGGPAPGQAGGAGGPAYAAQVADFGGGGGGGWGGSVNCGGTSGDSAVGGASGGVVQISSAVSIIVTATGGVHAGGGGGNGGCTQYAGGGGGSGGLVFLEAPTISTSGWLAANGGGGGSGSLDVANAVPGADGTMSLTAAPGGGGTNLSPGGGGAVGIADGGVRAAGIGGNVGNGFGSGGGGGGVGRIWLRTRRATATIDSTKVSPPAQLDTTL